MSKKEKPVIVIKYGGNAMTDDNLKIEVLENICNLQNTGYQVVIVHGGGPFIGQTLEEANIRSEFIDGHRKTTSQAMKYVEMALKGQVNGSLVGIINKSGYKAIGLSGRDGKIAVAQKRIHQQSKNGNTINQDLGHVGDIVKVNTHLLKILLQNDYIPVITCLADDEQGIAYNINADMFAGNIAGALKAEKFIVLTDVDGLLRDISDPLSLIKELNVSEIDQLEKENIIAGGMIPKVESCVIALEKGARYAQIINGTSPRQITHLMENHPVGTLITK